MAIPKHYLGAFKCGHREAAKEFIDEEFSFRLLERVRYGDQEAAHLLAYLTKFNNEYHKNVIKKGDTTALHNTDKLRRECYARENARNRDLMSVRKYMKIPMEELDRILHNELILLDEDNEDEGLSFLKTAS